MTRLQKVHRRAHREVDRARGGAMEHIRFRSTTKDAKTTKMIRFGFLKSLFVSFVIFVAQDTGIFFHALPWRMRQIVARQLKLPAQFRVESLERSSKFLFNPFARGCFFQLREMRNRLAKSDPDRSSSKRQPISLRVEAVASKYHARDDRNVRHVRQS